MPGLSRARRRFPQVLTRRRRRSYAVRRTVPPSAELEEQIDRLLSVGVGDHPRESLSELARLGARLIIQRAVEDEFDAWLGRARYERRPEYQRGLRNYESGLRNGFRARGLQAAEGELFRGDPPGARGGRAVRLKAVPARHEAAAHRAAEGVVIGAFVRGLSMRDESLCASGRTSTSRMPRRRPRLRLSAAGRVSTTSSTTSP